MKWRRVCKVLNGVLLRDPTRIGSQKCYMMRILGERTKVGSQSYYWAYMSLIIHIHIFGKDGKTYWWCEHYNVWEIHKPEDCKPMKKADEKMSPNLKQLPQSWWNPPTHWNRRTHPIQNDYTNNLKAEHIIVK